MRRARVQVRPNVGPRKSAGPSTPKPEATPSEKSCASSVEPLKSPTENVSTDVKPDTSIGKENTAMHSDKVENKCENTREITDSKNESVHTGASKTSNTKEIPENKEPPVPSSGEIAKQPISGSSTVAPPVIRRSKIKPMVKVKPRISGSRPSTTTKNDNTTHDAKVNVVPSKAVESLGTSDTNNTSSSLQSMGVSSENQSQDSSFTSIKPRTGDPIKPAVVHSDLSGLSPSRTTISKVSPTKTPPDATNEQTKACVIQLDQAAESSIINRTTVSVIPADASLDASQNLKDTTVVSVVKKDDHGDGLDPEKSMSQNSIITKVVPGRRHRLVKPRPNLTDSAQHRKRSASMSASDTDDELVKRHVHNINKRVVEQEKHVAYVDPHDPPIKPQPQATNDHVPIRKPVNRDVPLVATKLESNSADTSSEVLDVKPKSLFKLKAEREKVIPVRSAERRKGGLLEDPVDRVNMRICDLIYFNPSKNKMKSTIQEEEKRKKEADDIIGKVADNIPIESNPLPEPVSETPAAPLAPPPEPANVSEDEEPVMVPQVKIGADGQIIINEESLTVKQTEDTLEEGDSQVIEEFSNTPYNAKLYYKRSAKTKTWSWRETKRFYLALSVVGTDFSLMTNLFQGRNRNDLKKKFKKEEKSNRWLVDEALKNTKSYDISLFDQLTDTEDELEREKAAKEEQEKKEKAKKQNKPKAVNGDAAEKSGDAAKLTKKGKPRVKRRNITMTYAQSSDSETEKTNTQADKMQTNETSKANDADPKTNSDPVKPIAKKRRQTKKSKDGQENETQPKKRRTKKKKLEINTSAASANLPSGQVLLLSEGGQAAAGVPSAQGEMIHMYMLSPDPQRTGASTPGNISMSSNIAHSPRVSDSPNIAHRPRVHRDSINEALNIAPDESNPFASLLAQKLPNMMGSNANETKTKRNRTTSQNMQYILADFQRRREQEQQSMMMDLTLFGRDSNENQSNKTGPPSGTNVVTPRSEDEFRNTLNSPSRAGASIQVRQATTQKGQNLTTPQTVTPDHEPPPIEPSSIDPNIVSIIRLPSSSQGSPGVKQEKVFDYTTSKPVGAQQNNQTSNPSTDNGSNPATSDTSTTVPQSFISMMNDFNDQYSEVLDLRSAVSSTRSVDPTSGMRSSPVNLTVPRSVSNNTPHVNTTQAQFAPVLQSTPADPLSIPQPVFKIPHELTPQLVMTPGGNQGFLSPQASQAPFAGQSIMQGNQPLLTPGVYPLQMVPASQGASVQLVKASMSIPMSQSQSPITMVHSGGISQMQPSPIQPIASTQSLNQSQLNNPVTNHQPGIVITPSVGLIPPISAAKVATTASIRLVPQPAFMTNVSTPGTSQISPSTPQQQQQQVLPQPLLVIGQDGNLVNVSPNVDVRLVAQQNQSGIATSPNTSSQGDTVPAMTHMQGTSISFRMEERGKEATAASGKIVSDNRFSHLSPLRPSAQSKQSDVIVTSLGQPPVTSSTHSNVIMSFSSQSSITSQKQENAAQTKKRSSSVLPAPSHFGTKIQVPLKKSSPIVSELRQRNIADASPIATRLPMAQFMPSLETITKEKSSKSSGKSNTKSGGKGGKSSKNQSQDKAKGKKKAQPVVQKTRLPTATFGSDEECLKTKTSGCDVSDDDDDVDMSQQPIEWLENSTMRDTSDDDEDSVPTIKIRILKNTDKAPDKGQSSGDGEINLFVG